MADNLTMLTTHAMLSDTEMASIDDICRRIEAIHKESGMTYVASRKGTFVAIAKQTIRIMAQKISEIDIPDRYDHAEPGEPITT